MTMSHESTENLSIETNKKEYSQPTLTDFGKMSELTKTDPGPGVGFDGGDTPSSYIS